MTHRQKSNLKNTICFSLIRFVYFLDIEIWHLIGKISQIFCQNWEDLKQILNKN